MFSLYDELFLLALDDDKGNFLPFTRKTITYGLVGALLAELGLRNKICSNSRQRLEVIDTEPTGDVILDEILREISGTEKPRKFLFWVNLFAEHPKKLRTTVGESLAARNLVEQDDNRFLWTHSSKEAIPAMLSKYEMKEPLREMIFLNTEVNPHHLALLNLIGAAGLLNLIFTTDEIPTAKQLIQAKTMEAAITNPVLETVEAIGYAVALCIEEGID